MKTLVIHPQDKSTSFLDIVYKDIPNHTLITGGMTKEEVHEQIKLHDRILMCGHGTPHGLMSVGQFENCRGFIIDKESVPLLEEKNNIYIWCNADQFVERHKLSGFYSGMFISEVGEANYCGLPGMDQGEVDESNYAFVNIISKYINEDKNIIHENVKKEYGILAEENPIALYNNNRLYKL
jgi:hypothetical protein